MTVLMEFVPSTVFASEPYARFKSAFGSEMDELVASIKRSIRRETYRGVQEMCVTLENGKVVLSGHCKTFYTKQLAQQAAMKVIGTDELVNEIRVA